MNKKYLMKSVAFATVAMMAASCNHDAWYQKADPTAETAKEFDANFKNVVMGGQEIDANQTWSTSAASKVTVNVNLNYGETYTAYITEGNPLSSDDVAYLAMGKIVSGNSQTLTVSHPAGVGGYYIALFDKNGHAMVKPFAMEAGETVIQFGDADTAKAPTRAASTGNRWSVETKSMPALSSYTEGTTAIAAENNNTLPDNPVSKYLIPEGTTWTEQIPAIQAYNGRSVYVEGTWTVPADQRCTGGSVIVVGPKGVINIPAGHMLSTNANNNEGTTGMIYVMQGGKITGDGQLQFSNGTETYSYNGGIITVKDININGGTLYNAGTIGGVEGENNPALTGPAGTTTAPSKFINMGHATLASVGGAGISLENACNLNVVGKLQLGKSSKLDGGSYIECGSLELAGSNDGDITLYMGPAAYLKNKGDLNVNNFGVWGPTTGDNAIFEITNEVSYCNFTQNAPGSQMLDHVELIIPENYESDAVEIYNGGYETNYAGKVIYGWFNGLNYSTINPDAFQWLQDENWQWYQSTVANKNCWTYTNNANVTDDRRTCLMGTSPSYTVEADEEGCGNGFTSGGNKEPEANYVYFAFEDLGAADDFDFNDVVVRISTPDENGVASVELCAVGGTLETYVYNGKEQLGDEVHAEFGLTYGTYGVDDKGNTNKDEIVTPFKKIGEVTVPEGETVDDLNINIHVMRNDKSEAIVTLPAPGETPFAVRVSGDEKGKWFWPKERKNISDAYLEFGEWGADREANADWYKHPVTNLVVNW
ncbi:MAG: DUF4842 domain-containing protein [Prevotella sp.]|nr:DUF4842 domain-containing protein [Prevotella sp.]